MKAAVIERQGGLENLVYGDWPDPIPRKGEVLVKVGGCGLNHLDIFVRRGMPGFPVPMPFISGGDIAGAVAALGSEVTGWRIGDRVALHPVTHEGMMGEDFGFRGFAGSEAPANAKVFAIHAVRDWQVKPPILCSYWEQAEAWDRLCPVRR